MDKNRPAGRKVTHSGGGSGVGKTGGGLGGSSAGSGGFFGGGSGGSGHSGGSHSSSHGGHNSGSHSGGSFGSSGGSSSGSSGGGLRAVTRSKGGLMGIIVVILGLVFGGGGLAMNGMDGGTDYQEAVQYGSGTYNGWYNDSSSSGGSGVLNTKVSPDARAKYTAIRGDGTDTNTILVYMCGTDLESKSAMATSDLNEMISATVGKNINLIVYTGGCRSWRNSTISSSKNQVWQISNGGIKCLIDNAGSDSMTKASTLSGFIKWGAKNFPASRTSLIFWDHGGGSISGYGYDEKYPRSGSMTLANINTALKDAGIKYDFIGFDACLMATTETALMLGNYADYMIGSEETEPGIGWYYTNWLTSLSENPSLETLQIGKMIADDFTKQCAKKCPGQSTTLSVTDLAELSQTLPEKLSAFAEDAAGKISGGDYKQVASARSSSKEFARSTGIDQIDLIHFASLMDTSAGKNLAKTLTEAVKYNVTSSNTANAYGLSIYFPYKKLSQVDSMTHTYEAIGMDDDYTSCIRQFAQMQTAGQAVSGGTANPFEALMGSGSGSSDLTSQAMQQLIGTLFSSGFSGRSIGIDGLDSSNMDYMTEGGLDADTIAGYVTANTITSEDLVWQQNAAGSQALILTEDQWDLIQSADMNMLYDDGEGYIELGLDNIFEFDDDGNLLPALDRSWISINGQPVAYYHTETLESDAGATSSGYVPITLNGQEAHLILSIDPEGIGSVAGVCYDYDEDVTQTIAKNLTSLNEGDQVKFLCDYYTYDGKYQDKYKLGKTWTVDDPDSAKITNTDVGNGDVMILYKLTDIYGQEHWTPAIRQ
ncbi:MAG: peptidase C11 [Firmicutes bacterium]|nr:peptidase C11 [Bacillota bacterium]